jgi:hypothetical protein
MKSSLITENEIDWSPVLNQMRQTMNQRLPSYPGDLKTALLHQAGLQNHSQGEAAFQLAREISRLTTCCDPEITYWFARLISLIDR